MTTDNITDIPTIDVRTIPPYERHPRIFSALEALKPKQSLAIVSDHEPRPLHYQLQVKYPGLYGWSYAEQGPEVWRAIVTREVSGEHGCGCSG